MIMIRFHYTILLDVSSSLAFTHKVILLVFFLEKKHKKNVYNIYNDIQNEDELLNTFIGFCFLL
jgi:hypothetical protein